MVLLVLFGGKFYGMSWNDPKWEHMVKNAHWCPMLYVLECFATLFKPWSERCLKVCCTMDINLTSEWSVRALCPETCLWCRTSVWHIKYFPVLFQLRDLFIQPQTRKDVFTLTLPFEIAITIVCVFIDCETDQEWSCFHFRSSSV